MRGALLLAVAACACVSPRSFGPDRTAVIDYEAGRASCVTPPALFAFMPSASASASYLGIGGGVQYTKTGTRTYDLGERAQFLSSALFRVCELRAQGLITSTQAADLFRMVATDAADLLDVRRK